MPVTFKDYSGRSIKNLIIQIYTRITCKAFINNLLQLNINLHENEFEILNTEDKDITGTFQALFMGSGHWGNVSPDRHGPPDFAADQTTPLNFNALFAPVSSRYPTRDITSTQAYGNSEVYHKAYPALHNFFLVVVQLVHPTSLERAARRRDVCCGEFQTPPHYGLQLPCYAVLPAGFSEIPRGLRPASRSGILKWKCLTRLRVSWDGISAEIFDTGSHRPHL
ncbi:hypothetical protein CISG_07479 [Coccidioides immitis RMSCC 3703]|uniref:Uncharacterized protein n=1 Tax=Coccidioides immitis RMSCC 3703 TaxID=454286 RepID=A0A0J8R2B8_COCIT|nr:hypothetical protein CISG_07479 [Coccidioides immitis RMSCC 3703]